MVEGGKLAKDGEREGEWLSLGGWGGGWWMGGE